MRGVYIREINLPVLIEVYGIRKSGATPQIYIYYISAISLHQTILQICKYIQICRFILKVLYFNTFNVNMKYI